MCRAERNDGVHDCWIRMAGWEDQGVPEFGEKITGYCGHGAFNKVLETTAFILVSINHEWGSCDRVLWLIGQIRGSYGWESEIFIAVALSPCVSAFQTFRFSFITFHTTYPK
jgi:hypothetical protein